MAKCQSMKKILVNMSILSPHALILTAIVIAFATTAFFLVLAFRTYKELGTDNVERMKGVLDDD